MSIRSKVAGIAGAALLMGAGAVLPASAQNACPAGCDGATNWTGFWLGAGVGGNADMIGQNYIEYDYSGGAVGAETARGSDSERGGSGFFGTVALGYDWQIRDRWVLGAFTDFDFGKIDHTEKDRWVWSGGSGTAEWKFERNTTWNIGARIGLVTSNTGMFYGVIGYSRTSMDVSLTEDNGTRTTSKKGTLDYNGLILGAGFEQALGGGFSLKGEYRYVNYGDESFGGHENAAGNRWEVDDFDLDSHSVRFSLVYKFARGGDPVVEEVSYKDMPPAPYK